MLQLACPLENSLNPSSSGLPIPGLVLTSIQGGYKCLNPSSSGLPIPGEKTKQGNKYPGS